MVNYESFYTKDQLNTELDNLYAQSNMDFLLDYDPYELPDLTKIENHSNIQEELGVDFL